jgi:glutamate-1-semialdehyde 2,1-aminomutase
MTSNLLERARIIPGGSLTRSKNRFGLHAISASGAEITASDGRTYLDMLCGLGAVSLGHRGAPTSDGVCSLPWAWEVFAGEAVLEHVAPWASHVRFTKTGSEACHAAYRIAKAITGRSTVLVGDWAYHGWHEWAAERGPVIGDEGSYEYRGTTLQFRHGQQLFAPHPENIAAVVVEPHRWEPVRRDWMRHVRDFCHRIGALLIFDSMIYGGRWALGGTSQWFGLHPDLECFGKAIGNGQSVACVVGRDALKQHGELVSGTYSGDPVGLESVVTTVATYTSEPVIHTLWMRGSQLRVGLDQVLKLHGELGGCCEGEAVHQRVTFRDERTGLLFAEEMQNRGILWHPACVNTMYAHTDAQIDRVIEAAEQSCRAVRERL